MPGHLLNLGCRGGDTNPSPPGLFAIWDDMGVSVKRIEPILNSNPQLIKITSDNNLVADTTELVVDTKIWSRVVWSAQKM